MVYWNMLKKLRGHGCLQPGEEPVAAVYGLGEAMLSMADAASSGLELIRAFCLNRPWLQTATDGNSRVC